MTCDLKIVFGLLLSVACAVAAGQPKRGGGTPGPPPAAKPAPRGGGVPRPRQPMGPPIGNPSNPAVRLYRASPDQRERALEQLPAKMQEQIRKQLQRFDALEPGQKRIVIAQIQHFAALSPAQQQVFRRQFQAFSKLPPERRRPIALALRRLEAMPEAERAPLLSSDAFKSEFSTEDLQMISDLSLALLPPQ